MENQNWKDIVGNLFEGLADLLDRAGKPIFSFIAVVIPYLAPIVIAQITATALVDGHILNTSQSKQLAFVIEGIGVVGLSGLVVAIDTWIKSKNKKTEVLIWLLAIIDVLYFLFLISVNVLLDANNPQVTSMQTVIKAIICVVPLLAGGIYGYYRIVNQDKIASNDAKHEAYVIRQEQREDRLKAKAIKQGFNPFAQPTVTLNQDVPQAKEQKEKHASDYREKAIQFILDYHLKNRKLPAPKHLTERFNLDHAKNKGYMSVLIREVANQHNLQ